MIGRLLLAGLLGSGLAYADAWRVEGQTVHHVSASTRLEANATVMNGLGVALIRTAGERWAFLGAVLLEGSRLGGIDRVALPLTLAVRWSILRRPGWGVHLRAGLGAAREWITLRTPAGIYARDDFLTGRFDVGAGGAWMRDGVSLGVEARLVSLHRSSRFGDGPERGGDPEGPLPASASGVELGLVLSWPLGH